MDARQTRQPGDLILDRYMPDATPEEREVARENLKRLARLMLRVEVRKAREWYEQQIRASGDPEVDSEVRACPPP